MKDSPFWSFVTLAVLGVGAVLLGRYVWRKVSPSQG